MKDLQLTRVVLCSENTCLHVRLLLCCYVNLVNKRKLDLYKETSGERISNYNTPVDSLAGR